MGQKVHPLGFRVGITKKHQTQWFARFHKQKYAQTILEDRMLRQTLTDLFPQLLNPIKAQKRVLAEEAAIVPHITQIKIKRGLIPYEIGIQIHAENCDLLKSSVENLKINQDLMCQFQKTRRYLQHLRLKLNDLSVQGGLMESASQKLPSLSEGSSSHSVGPKGGLININNINKEKKEETLQSGEFRFGKQPRKRLTKQQMRRQRLVLKRLKKRQNIYNRYKKIVGFLSKNGNKIVQKQKNPYLRSSKTTTAGRLLNTNTFKKQANTLNVKSYKEPLKGASSGRMSFSNEPLSQNATLFRSRIKKKFVSIFVDRMNKNFLQALKVSLKKASAFPPKENEMGQNINSSKNGLLRKQWVFNLNSKEEPLKNTNIKDVTSNVANQQSFKHKKPTISQLTKLISVLEQKSLKKMESLRRDFIAFGTISKTASFNYYQMLMFLKQLKEHVSFLKRKQKLQFTIQSISKINNEKNLLPGSLNKETRLSNSKASSILIKETSTTLNIFSKKLNNIEKECQKIKLIEYLKNLVKKHRTENIYLYLTSISEARKELQKLKQFTKSHASFLFGLNLSSTPHTLTEQGTPKNADVGNFAEKVKERVNNILEKSASKKDFEKTLQDVFLEQIEKQRKMYKDNAQLIPKISIQFYSVNSNAIKAKASIVADSVIDALEKRKAFRKVVKDAKEELMRTSGIKGVKIQLSGRLNGAEIARSEWVRAGRVPLQTLRANIDYSYKTANTIYGIIGVKVWIFKGYTVLNK